MSTIAGNPARGGRRSAQRTGKRLSGTPSFFMLPVESSSGMGSIAARSARTHVPHSEVSQPSNRKTRFKTGALASAESLKPIKDRRSTLCPRSTGYHAGGSWRIGGTRQRGTVPAHTAACPAGRVRRAWPGTVPPPGKRRECDGYDAGFHSLLIRVKYFAVPEPILRHELFASSGQQAVDVSSRAAAHPGLAEGWNTTHNPLTYMMGEHR
jgi:hypothetical protein